jgi:PHD/YefM family antitoxin component YafN of YafNO toxin-antitoxin module
MTQAAKAIRRLHDQVCTDKHRVEITRRGCDDVCVLISRKELESLEQALQIFADTEAFMEMSENLKKVLALADEIYAAPVYEGRNE